MYAPAQNRTFSAFAASLIVAGGVLALMAGLSFAPQPLGSQSMLEAILPTRSTPVSEPKPERSRAKAGAPREAAAPSAPGNRAAPIVLPPPPLPPLITPPPVVTAPLAGTGAAPDQGAANAGSGQGAGGAGAGLGGGGNGASGGGLGRGNFSAYPRQVAGKLHYWEIPKELRRDHGGVIRLRYRIGTDGRVSDCTVLQSSGLPEFDEATCARISERFRFKPALDPQGRPVPFVMTEIHGWNYEPGAE